MPLARTLKIESEIVKWDSAPEHDRMTPRDREPNTCLYAPPGEQPLLHDGPSRSLIRPIRACTIHTDKLLTYGPLFCSSLWECSQDFPQLLPRVLIYTFVGNKLFAMG